MCTHLRSRWGVDGGVLLMHETAKPSAQTVLKPCPCCGGEAHFRTETASMAGQEYQVGYVICMDCGMRTRSAPMDGFTGVDWVEEDFAALWNRRAGDGKVDVLGEYRADQ